VTLGAAWNWQGGSIPDLTGTTNAIDIVSGVVHDSQVYATLVKNFA
jgi:hypothetical protein